MALPEDNKHYPSALLCLALFAIFFCTPLFITADTKAKEEQALEGIIIAGDFSGTAEDMAPWKELFFHGIKRHTVYRVEGRGKDAYLRAEAEASASALYRKVELNLAEYPILSWRWKIDGIIQNGDARTKAGDDYTARIYVTFAYEPAEAGLINSARHELAERLFGIHAPGSALNYIWANNLGKDAVIPSPYTNQEMMIAVESGAGKAGLWQREERNVYEDYIRAFGHKPPRLTGIAVMTDSDNTGGSAGAYYGNILFRKNPNLKRLK